MRFFVLTTGLLIAGFVAVAPSQVAATPIKMMPTSVTASSTASGTSPSDAVDGLPNTIWNAGGRPAQWIQLDFGRSFALRKIRLQVEQAPSGVTRHRVLVGQSPSDLREVTVFAGNTVNAQWLEFDAGERNGKFVRYVRVLTDQSPSWVAWKEIEVYQGVEYLGFFRDAVPKHGTGNHIDETTAAGANLVWVGGSASEIATRLNHALVRGAKAMVDVEQELFTESHQLRSDFETRWRAIADQIRRFPGVVASFYLVDEPYLSYDPAATRSALAAAAARVRQDFSQIPISVILSVNELERIGSEHVSMFNWVGFDRYRDFAELPPIIARLEGILIPSQRMIAVPWAFRFPRDSDGEPGAPLVFGHTNQDELVQNINGWHREILSNARYIAVVPFLWQNFAPTGAIELVGARELPWVAERTKQLAYSVLQKIGTQVFPMNETGTGAFEEALLFGAFNRDPSDEWNSGGFPIQFISAELPGSSRVGRITMTVHQAPEGPTTHVIWGTKNGAWTELGRLQGHTRDGQVLVWRSSVPQDVSSIRIQTIQSPSWVGWNDIQMFTF